MRRIFDLSAFDLSYWVPSAQVMHRQLGTDMQVKGIPTGKHQSHLKPPPPQLCARPPPRGPNPAPLPVPQAREPITRVQGISALHFSVASAAPRGFCKVFPVDLADGLRWHVANSAKNTTTCWPQPRPGFVFVWPFKKNFFSPNHGHGSRREGKLKILPK